MTERAKGRRALGQFALIGLLLIAIAALMPSSVVGDRISVAAFGGLAIALGVLKPSGFWDVASVAAWRGAFGDAGVQLVYVAIGVAWIVAALAGKI